MRGSIQLLSNMVCDIKCRITSSIDISRKDPHQTYPYASGHFDEKVPLEHLAYVSKLKLIRDKASQTRDALRQSQQITFLLLMQMQSRVLGWENVLNVRLN